MLFLCNNHILRNRKTPSTILVDLAALCDGQQECHLGKLRSGMWDRCVLCVCVTEKSDAKLAVDRLERRWLSFKYLFF